ncbi:hypothetical protein [Inconstantimicrobium mannanitabidum]|uniref:Uncharacterized protein n=1 Tax=Inconstantimicrobium mannanitabidum TaxID=1604901 RepID=A0ACB5RIL2_9CLOT|nr:hypothetical protein [Clostridium sp. TW13]GKX68924.1 hypothetical protein rsdtw13_41820 [Clostridium sp. TW13]
MRKKIIIFVIGLVLVLACFFEYSNYQNKVTVTGGQSNILVAGDSDTSRGNIELEDNVKCVSLNIDTECGEFIKSDNGSYGQNMKKIPNKGSVIIRIKDDESNVVKSFTIKGGESLSKIVLLGKGNYSLEIGLRDGFQGKIEPNVYAWKLI